MRKKILFVHEDEAVLVRFAGHLDAPDSEWDSEFVLGADEAIDSMSRDACDVVITGGSAGTMTGKELLERVAEEFPETVRIVMTDPDDLDGFMKRVGHAHQFVSETCRQEDLQETLRRASHVRDFLEDAGLKRLVSKIETLPSLPSLYTQIIEELQSNDPSIVRVARTICDDVSMAAKTIQMVNSVAFAPRAKINDPMRASIYLGIEMLKSLVLSARVFAQFDGMQVAELTVGALWDHSLYVASLAQQIARDEGMDKADIDDAFLCGVLHDVGKLILAVNVPESYLKAMQLGRDNEIPAAEAERIVFGATHADVGAFLMALWGLSDNVVRGIQYHHDPSRGGSDRLDALTLVHIANRLAHQRLDDDDEGEIVGIDYAHLDRLGVAERLQDWREYTRS